MSGEPTFLVDTLPRPGAAGSVLLDGPEGRHAATVQRLRVGEALVLTDGAGAWTLGTVEEVRRDALLVRPGEIRQDPPPPLRIVVVQALPKGERGELAVDLATEAGADGIVPWAAARSIARWDRDKATRGVEKWRATARSAAKQARRRYVPPVDPLAGTAQVVERISAATLALVLHESATEPLTGLDLPAAGELLLVVGPEGGVSPEELTAFTGAGARAVRLGREVLRSSTAAAVALGALAVLTGRWD